MLYIYVLNIKNNPSQIPGDRGVTTLENGCVKLFLVWHDTSKWPQYR
jgi:hypothetical protein